MTNPVILLGTQSNGETLPVQVDATGRLVAEGLPGPPGPEGPQGPEGEPGSLDLPPDPYEGALLGWLNNGLAWIGTPPVPIPPGRFGPITAWNSTDYVLTVEGGIPETVSTGVYIYQCDEDGVQFTDGALSSDEWSNYWSGTITNRGGCFGSLDNLDSLTSTSGNGRKCTFTAPGDGIAFSQMRICVRQGAEGQRILVNGRLVSDNTSNNQRTISWSSLQGYGVSSPLTSLEIEDGIWGGDGPGIYWVELDGLKMMDASHNLNMRVQSVMGDMLIGLPNMLTVDFQVGAYVKTKEQRVAPWVLYGNDPTTRIDYLRQQRD